MAATLEQYKANLILVFEMGVGVDGRSILKRITIPGVRYNLTADELAQIARSFGNLTSYPILEVENVKIDTLLGIY